jgi:membrane protein
MKKQRGFLYWLIIKETFSEFDKDNATKLSAALAYYTIFSIAPMLVVIISLCGIFLGQQAVSGELFEQIRTYVGDAAALQIQSMIGSIAFNKGSVIASVVGIITMLIGATGVFTEIQDSLNLMWGVRVKKRIGILNVLINRSLSFIIVLGMGLVLLLSLFISGILTSFANTIQRILPWFPLNLVDIVNTSIIITILTALFIVIYKILPDAKISFRDSLIGSVFTTILFLLGKWGITFYLGWLTVNSTYGAAASLVIILLWVYYSAIIFYFGAEFTHVYAIHAGSGIKAKQHSVLIKEKELN